MSLRVFNCDCITGAKEFLAEKSTDLLICDPPFGIGEATFHKHYHRDESTVLDGYVEAPDDYREFSTAWLAQARRVLKDDGSLYVVSGWTNLHHILAALDTNGFFTINHIIWKFNFGCNASSKFVSSHYHILYAKKTKTAKVKFNLTCRFGTHEKLPDGGSVLYRDLEDVWVINKEYMPGEKKNKNKLPDELIRKMVLYSSDPGDVVGDFFLGNFTTANVAKRLGRVPVGFEINKEAFDYFTPQLEAIESGCDLKTLRVVEDRRPANKGKPLTQEEIDCIVRDYQSLLSGGSTKKDAVAAMQEKYGRGYWSIQKLLKKALNSSADSDDVMDREECDSHTSTESNIAPQENCHDVEEIVSSTSGEGCASRCG